MIVYACKCCVVSFPNKSKPVVLGSFFQFLELNGIGFYSEREQLFAFLPVSSLFGEKMPVDLLPVLRINGSVLLPILWPSDQFRGRTCCRTPLARSKFDYWVSLLPKARLANLLINQ